MHCTLINEYTLMYTLATQLYTTPSIHLYFSHHSLLSLGKNTCVSPNSVHDAPKADVSSRFAGSLSIRYCKYARSISDRSVITFIFGGVCIVDVFI